MHKISKFILKEFSLSFFTIFFVISSIISLIYIITISNITSKFEITFIELIKFYLLFLPQIILITLSISFLISAISTYSKFSEMQELIALFSLGFKPSKILFPIFIVAIIITIINNFILFISIPYSKIAFTNLKNEKIQESKFNFQSAHISQQFGKWLIFAQKSNNNTFFNIFLLSPDNTKFIIANKSFLTKKDNILTFTLLNGRIYDYNKTYLINFKKMKINNSLPTLNSSIFNFVNYFNLFKKEFTKYLPIAFIPIALFFFIPLFSFFHPRLIRHNPLILILLTLFIYIIFTLFNKIFVLSFIIILSFFISGGLLYKWKIKF